MFFGSALFEDFELYLSLVILILKKVFWEFVEVVKKDGRSEF